MHLFYSLETTCRGQLLLEAAAANGLKKKVIDDEDAEYTAVTEKDPDSL